MSRTHLHIGVVVFFIFIALAVNGCARMPIPTVAPTLAPPTATPIPPTPTATPIIPTATPTITPIPTLTPTPAPFLFSSSAFADGATLPAKYTCDGENVSPPLSWTGVPRNAKSLVVMMDDPDAVVATFTHWILFDIPASSNGLAENVKGVGKGGLTSAKRVTYAGPCPPSGVHRFVFQLYALDQETLGFNEGVTRPEIEKAMNGHILGKLSIIGMYGKK